MNMKVHSQHSFVQSRVPSAKKNNTGAFMGQRVQVRSANTAQSLLADAAEELTFAFNLSDKFAREKRKERQRFEVAYFKRARRYKELKTSSGDSTDFDDFFDTVLSHEDADDHWCLEQALKRFSDPTDAWIALFDALDNLEQRDAEVNATLIKSVRTAMHNLEDDQGAAIVTGMLGFTEASEFAELADGETLGSFYRDIVCDFEDAEDVFKNIKENWSTLNFDKGIDFLFHTLSVDLGADEPSMGRVHLEHIFNNLGKVRLLQSTYIIIADLLKRWETVHMQSNSNLNVQGLLESIVHLGKERYLGTMHVDAIVKQANPPDIELEILFIQDLLGAVRSLPATLYDGNEGLAKVVHIFQTALDAAIEREDAYLASLEGE